MREKQNQPLTPERFAELVERAKTGDQDAYTALYRATDQEVYRTVRSMVKGEDTALDIQQDAYVYAFTHLDQLGEPGKFRSWLRTIAVNRTRSVLRKQTPVLFSELESEEGAGIPEVADLSPEASPELRLERQETADYVREILDGLTVGQRMLVGLYYYEQLPVGKIAEDLGVTPGTVKTQLYRSRKKIEAAVKRLEEKGVKLFGLAPISFLTALLKRQEPAAETGKALMTETLTKAGVVPAAEAVGLHVGRTFFQTAVGKVVLGLIAAGVVAGSVAGYRWARANHVIGDYQPPTETLEINLHYDTDEDLTEPTAETEPTTEPDTAEDLTEPTDPEETTEPTDPEETTEPTEPEETTAPTDPTDPVGAGDHTGPAPTDPTDPTNPAGGGDHTGPAPTDPTDPTEEPTTEPTEPTTEPTESSTLPTTPPYPPSPGTVTIALGETWTYSGSGDPSVTLTFLALRSRCDSYDSSAVIGVQENGNAALSFRPEEAGIYKIYYHAANSENLIYWATITVTGGTEG